MNEKTVYKDELSANLFAESLNLVERFDETSATDCFNALSRRNWAVKAHSIGFKQISNNGKFTEQFDGWEVVESRRYYVCKYNFMRCDVGFDEAVSCRTCNVPLLMALKDVAGAIKGER